GVGGGRVARGLTAGPQEGAWFAGGVVAYDNRLKREVLGVPGSLIEQFGAVSPQVAEAMAVGCRTRLGTDLALATVGIAGPGDAGPDRPVGMVFAALAREDGVRSGRLSWIGTRSEIQSRTAKLALNLVRLHLQSL